MRPLHAWTSHHLRVALPPHHRLPVGKHPALIERIQAEGLVDVLHRSEPAPREWLELVHDGGFVARALEGGLDAGELRALGVPWSPELVTRARAGVGGTVSAARAALVHGVAGNVAGGSHHAFRDHGEAWCLFNDLAIAIEVLRGEGTVARPFVLDLDVHQGNGTAEVFTSDPAVFTFSIHGESNYPARKVRGSFDLGLPPGTGDEAYLAALDRHVPERLDHHRPDLVLYQAGVDALAEDGLGQLALSHRGLRARDARVFAWCVERGLPVAITLGGGYSRPPDASIESHLGVWREARAARDRRPSVTGGDAAVHAVDTRHDS
jgi:acetoin utilization deacetylase AcuC-like enzyme